MRTPKLWFSVIKTWSGEYVIASFMCASKRAEMDAAKQNGRLILITRDYGVAMSTYAQLKVGEIVLLDA